MYFLNNTVDIKNCKTLKNTSYINFNLACGEKMPLLTA